jgi:hypothetical protein
MGLASAVFLESESLASHGHMYILLSQILNSSNLEGHSPVFISPRNRVAQLYPQALGFSVLCSQSHVTTDGQTASVTWC